MYLQHKINGEVIAAELIYVDDLQLASKNQELKESLVDKSKGWWPCPVQATGRFLRIQIEHNMSAGTLSVHQQASVEGMVAKYECADEYDALLPLPPSVRFLKDSCDMGEALQDGNLYSSLASALNLLSLCTRPGVY